MTIERPFFPPIAAAQDSLKSSPAIGQPEGQTLTGESVKPAEAPLPSATILEMRPRAINLLAQRPEYEGLSPWKAKSKHEETSSIIKAAVTYICNQSAWAPGFIADHTCDGVFAGGIVGDKHTRAAARSKRKLVNLMDQATTVLTVELWSLASVVRFVVKQIEDDEPFDQEELRFLKSFAGLVERLCEDQYKRELQAVKS